jgi:predicted nucleic acid-binding protein
VEPIIVDASILFSALLGKESRFAQLILGSERRFFICESTVVELFKHKEKIVRLSKLTENELIRVLYVLLRRVTVCKEELIKEKIRRQAYDLCVDIDVADTPYIALTIQIGGLLWTGDKKLKKGLQKKGFNRFFEP